MKHCGKALWLVSISDLISQVLVYSDNRMVASFVEMKSKGQFVCSGTCHRFTAYKICEHIIVGCDDCVFCNNWWRSRKSGPNLYAYMP